METIRRSQHAFIAVKSNYVVHTIEERGAMAALRKMLIQHRSLDGVKILIDVI